MGAARPVVAGAPAFDRGDRDRGGSPRGVPARSGKGSRGGRAGRKGGGRKKGGAMRTRGRIAPTPLGARPVVRGAEGSDAVRRCDPRLPARGGVMAFPRIGRVRPGTHGARLHLSRLVFGRFRLRPVRPALRPGGSRPDDLPDPGRMRGACPGISMQSRARFCINVASLTDHLFRSVHERDRRRAVSPPRDPRPVTRRPPVHAAPVSYVARPEEPCGARPVRRLPMERAPPRPRLPLGGRASTAPRDGAATH